MKLFQRFRKDPAYTSTKEFLSVNLSDSSTDTAYKHPQYFPLQQQKTPHFFSFISLTNSRVPYWFLEANNEKPERSSDVRRLLSFLQSALIPGQGQAWDEVGTTDGSYEITLDPPYPGARSHDSSFRNTSVTEEAGALVGGRYFRENEFTPRHTHKSHRFFSMVNARRRQFMGYQTPLGLIFSLESRKSTEGAGAFVQIATGWTGARGPPCSPPCRALGNWAWCNTARYLNEILPLFRLVPRLERYIYTNPTVALHDVPDEISVPLFAYLWSYIGFHWFHFVGCLGGWQFRESFSGGIYLAVIHRTLVDNCSMYLYFTSVVNLSVHVAAIIISWYYVSKVSYGIG